MACVEVQTAIDVHSCLII